MSKRDNHRVKLTDFLDKKSEEGKLEIETPDGQVFTIPAPETWSDETFKVVKSGTEDPEVIGRALFGDRYDAFVAAGGGANMALHIFNDFHGLTAGE